MPTPDDIQDAKRSALDAWREYAAADAEALRAFLRDQTGRFVVNQDTVTDNVPDLGALKASTETAIEDAASWFENYTTGLPERTVLTGWHPNNDREIPVNISDRFKVPLEAAGYSVTAGMTIVWYSPGTPYGGHGNSQDSFELPLGRVAEYRPYEKALAAYRGLLERAAKDEQAARRARIADQWGEP